MHSSNWKTEYRNIGVLLLGAVFIGLLTDSLPWVLFISTCAYSAWLLYQLQRIHSWLYSEEKPDPPEAKGLWGDVFDGIYRLQRRGKEEQLRLQAVVDYLQDSFASLDDGAVMIDSRGNIEWTNRAAEKLLGLRYPEDTQQQLINFIRAPEFIRYFEQQDYSQSLQLTSPYNNHYELQISVSSFGRGSRLLFVRDITVTNRMQQMLKDFVANVSHELRTPLTVIIGYLETLSDNGSALGDELRWRRAVDQMLNQSHRMESLIKDLIVLSRLESMPGVADQAPIAIRPMLEVIRDDVLVAVKGPRKINIECDDSVQLVGNSVELQSAFSNLVMNAAKYTPVEGEITIRWFADHRHLYLAVEDRGEGIESHHLPRLTERFYRVDKSRSIDTGGTGLGLAIVKHILLHHEAELTISSRVGEGSTFSCVFPRSRAFP
jgi:two-component system phosphate regulon sensor histidine kinase PhoR